MGGLSKSLTKFRWGIIQSFKTSISRAISAYPPSSRSYKAGEPSFQNRKQELVQSRTIMYHPSRRLVFEAIPEFRWELIRVRQARIGLSNAIVSQSVCTNYVENPQTFGPTIPSWSILCWVAELVAACSSTEDMTDTELFRIACIPKPSHPLWPYTFGGPSE